MGAVGDLRSTTILRHRHLDQGPAVVDIRISHLYTQFDVGAPPSPRAHKNELVALQLLVQAPNDAGQLKADGIVGAQTLIQLNTGTADPSIPLLYTQSKGEERHVIYP